MSFHQPWTPQELAAAVDMRAAGLTNTVIAVRLQRSENGVAYKLREYRKRQQTGREVRYFAGRFWTEDQLEQCVKLWREGHTSQYIGLRIAKSRNAVIGKMGRLNIEQGKPAPAPIMRGMREPEPQPEPKPLPPPEPIDYAARVCACNNRNPCQPGRGLCSSCLRDRMRPNARQSMWVGVGGAA